MPRSTAVIAAIGVGLLIVAVAVAAIRGPDDDVAPPSAQPTTEATTPTDGDTEPADEPTTEDTATPTEGATDATEPADDGTAAGDDGTPGDDSTPDDDATGDDARDPDSSGVTDMPETGGGALAVLGAALAATGAVAGRRSRPGHR